MATLALAAPLAAQSSPPCQLQVFRGRVNAGQTYRVELSDALVFRLDADSLEANPPGWIIRVAPPATSDDDYSMVATPPYRFANARYVDTSYGVTAEQALAHTPRAFAFVASPADYASARRALDVLLWPYSFTDAQVDSAGAVLDALPAYPATFFIEGGEVSAPTPTYPVGRIEWMTFRLEACVPPA